MKKAVKKKDINLVELRKYILYPVIVGVLTMLIFAGITWFLTIGDNKQQIENLKTSKVDVEKFNTFLRMYTEFAVLTEARDQIQNKRLEVLEVRQRKIELEKLTRIERSIEIIQNKMKELLKEYGMYTKDRNGNEMEISDLSIISKT